MRYASVSPTSVSALAICHQTRAVHGLAFLGLILWNRLWFAKPAHRVELAPSLFEAIHAKPGLKLGQPRLH